MLLGNIILGAAGWLPLAATLAAVALAVLGWSYSRTSTTTVLRAVCLLLKASAFVLLALCLVDPLYVGSRPRPGSNLFLVLADNSRSLQLSDQGQGKSRGSALHARLNEKEGWLTRLAQDFDVRQYKFDTTLHSMQDYSTLAFDGEASALAQSLPAMVERYKGQPVAGILLFSDGNATDLVDQQINWKNLPPVFPVTVASASPALDVALTQVAVSQTNFEAAPVKIEATVVAQSVQQRKVIVRVLNEAGTEVERHQFPTAPNGEPQVHRFLIKAEKPGVSFYQVQAALEGEEAFKAGDKSQEATLANNRRIATVDRGGGPYRVLYISGLPNWEFKFLRRAVEKDDEVDLVGLVRIARREPKFTFLSRDGESTNPLFRGFTNQKDEDAQQYDQPVLLRLGTKDKDELQGGFPKDAEELYKYHAVILDDIESAFFTQDQMSLLQQFVSQRGGGLLMMGGKASFAEGGYIRSPVAEMLPVYLDRTAPAVSNGGYRLKITPEGKLQPWVRLRPNEEDDDKRFTEMPGFHALNRIDAIKPAASVLLSAEAADGSTRPALAVQPFGRGRTAALLIGDLWRWGLRRPDATQNDLERSWRQTVRWLVADVPQPVELETKRSTGAGLPAVEIVVRARDKKFSPLDNASITLNIKTPDQREIQLAAESSSGAAGEYHARFTPRTPGAYRVMATAAAPDGSPVGQRETGWAVEPETEEFQQLNGNTALLERIAADSGGEVIALNQLDRFVSSLPNRKLPIVERWTYPLWHQWSVLAAAMCCLIGEWGLRRWKGLP